MHRLQILISSQDAESVADHLKQELSPIGDITVRKLSSRGLDIFVILELTAAAINTVAMAERFADVVVRLVSRCRDKSQLTKIMINDRGRKLAVETNDVKSLDVNLVSHFLQQGRK